MQKYTKLMYNVYKNIMAKIGILFPRFNCNNANITMSKQTYFIDSSTIGPTDKDLGTQRFSKSN